MSQLDNNNVHFGTIDRIREARDGYNGAVKSRNEALVKFYSVFLDAEKDATVASAIEQEFNSLPNHPKSKATSTWIGYIAFSSEKQRVSEVHKILQAAKGANIAVEGMMEWLIVNARTVKRGGSVSAGPKRLHDLHKVSNRIFELANNKVVLSSSPYAAACEADDYLIQVCQKQSDGTFVSVWLHATAKDSNFVSSKPVAAPAQPKTIEDIVAQAKLLEAA